MKGLTPYLVVDITEDEVQLATAHEDAVVRTLLASSSYPEMVTEWEHSEI